MPDCIGRRPPEAPWFLLQPPRARQTSQVPPTIQPGISSRHLQKLVGQARANSARDHSGIVAAVGLRPDLASAVIDPHRTTPDGAPGDAGVAEGRQWASDTGLRN